MAALGFVVGLPSQPHAMLATVRALDVRHADYGGTGSGSRASHPETTEIADAISLERERRQFRSGQSI